MFVGYQCVFVRQAESGDREHEGEIGGLAPSKRQRLRQKAKIAEAQVPTLNEVLCWSCIVRRWEYVCTVRPEAPD